MDESRRLPPTVCWKLGDSRGETDFEPEPLSSKTGLRRKMVSPTIQKYIPQFDIEDIRFDDRFTD